MKKYNLKNSIVVGSCLLLPGVYQLDSPSSSHSSNQELRHATPEDVGGVGGEGGGGGRREERRGNFTKLVKIKGSKMPLLLPHKVGENKHATQNVG